MSLTHKMSLKMGKIGKAIPEIWSFSEPNYIFFLSVNFRTITQKWFEILPNVQGPNETNNFALDANRPSAFRRG